MAKGKANPVLCLMVDARWLEHPKIQALIAQGHIVAVFPEGDPGPDLILHPAAHQWNDELWDYLDVALKAARARRRKK